MSVCGSGDRSDGELFVIAELMPRTVGKSQDFRPLLCPLHILVSYNHVKDAANAVKKVM